MKNKISLILHLLDKMPFPIMIKNISDDFKYLFWNKQCESFFEINKEEVLGKTDIEIYGENKGARIRQQDIRVVQSGINQRVEELLENEKPKKRYAVREKFTIKAGDLNLLIVVWWDITEYVRSLKINEQLNKEKESLNDRNKLILENANVGLAFVDLNHSVLWSNLSSHIKHPQLDEFNCLFEKKCYKIRGLNSPCSDCMINKVLQTGITQKKISFNFLDGLVFEITASVAYGENQQEAKGVVIRFDDITEKYKKDKELEQAKIKAEKANELKDIFLANMSHEIRTPLNAIVGFSQIMLETENSDEKRKYANIITQNNKLLLQLIDDVFDISSITSGTVSFSSQQVDINSLMINLEHMMRFKVKDNPKVEITFTQRLPECIIHTDKERLEQVLINLINNALKFTEQGYIHFGYQLIENNKLLRCFVYDTGIGIPEDKQQIIFERFAKLNTFKQGLGLGLAISKMIVEKLGGKINVETNDKGGCLFYFTVLTRSVINEPLRITDSFNL